MPRQSTLAFQRFNKKRKGFPDMIEVKLKTRNGNAKDWV
jgi:hypothetical protein